MIYLARCTRCDRVIRFHVFRDCVPDRVEWVCRWCWGERDTPKDAPVKGPREELSDDDVSTLREGIR